MSKKLLSAAGIVCILVSPVFSKNDDLTTDKSKYSYAIGIQFGRSMKGNVTDIDYKSLAAGIQDVLEGKKIRLTDDEIKSVMALLSQRMEIVKKEASEKKRREGEEYLNKNKTRRGVITTKSGLQYEILSTGSGDSPGLNDVVRVHYRGSLIDGEEIDNSYKRNNPAEFPVNGVIPGWTEALQLMKKGSKFRLTIPSHLAYGENGASMIPGNSVLIFEVELIDIISKDQPK